jgi:hypothetical protein
MATKQAIKVRHGITIRQNHESPGLYQNRGIQRHRPPRIGPKQEDFMRKDNPFHTLAEALEAGEPHLIDKITGERDARFFTVGDDESHNLLKIERVFHTVSGAYVILARPRTDEEEAEKERRHRAIMAAFEKADEARIRASMERPDYILIAWRYTGFVSRNETMVAYYLPKTGPRFVYIGSYKTSWDYDKEGRELKTAKQDGEGLSRWGRREVVEGIKKDPKDYRLCAPLWLLTNIHDPRPEYLTKGETE